MPRTVVVSRLGKGGGGQKQVKSLFSRTLLKKNKTKPNVNNNNNNKTQWLS